MTYNRAKTYATALLPRLARKPQVTRFLTRLNVALYRLSGGRLANQVNGCPVCLITMTGRKSGKRMTIALMYVPYGEEVLLVASLGGAPKNPQWFYNLSALPHVQVQIGRHRRAMHARLTSGEERELLWPIAVAHFPPYANYQSRTERQIPLFRCSAA